MADNVYYPETIQDNDLTKQESVNLNVTESSSGDTSTPTKIEDQSLPTKKIAFEVIGSALNTKSRRILEPFGFTESGALQIGKYEPGQTGDIKISPTGIVARNSSGITTIAIDGETGDAVFSGIIQSGTLIAGDVVVGDNTIRLDGENKRIIINDGTNDRVLIGLF